MYMNNTKGLLFNNPLCIKQKRFTWKGQLRNPEEPLCYFVSLSYGYRAAWIHLNNYLLWLAQHGKTYCIKSIVTIWAEGRADVRECVNKVSRLVYMDKNSILKAPFLDREKFMEIIAAMTCVANDIPMNKVDYDAIKAGFKLAFGNM